MHGIASRLVAAIVLGTATVAANAASPSASSPGFDRNSPIVPHFQEQTFAGSWTSWWNDHWAWNGHSGHQDPGPVAAAPELDPATALSGLTLLLGGLAVVRGRRQRS